ncbi:MAG: hypothetical protein ACRDRH_08155 [Pseudonocardia sp.]
MVGPRTDQPAHPDLTNVAGICYWRPTSFEFHAKLLDNADHQ